MKLIKLNTDHYIIVDDSEIKEGDYYLFTWGGEQEIQRFSKKQYADRENHRHLYDNACKKITHSTDINFNEVYYIPLSEVKELIGEVDVEKKADKMFPNPYVVMEGLDIAPAYREGYVVGYNQALEDSKEKKYTENQAKQIWKAGQEYWKTSGASITFEELTERMIKQPKTEWEVEFVDGKLKLK